MRNSSMIRKCSFQRYESILNNRQYKLYSRRVVRSVAPKALTSHAPYVVQRKNVSIDIVKSSKLGMMQQTILVKETCLEYFTV